jgi:bifunctional non-homologous end joining protein LigD
MARTLETYNKKRDFAATPEPSGKPARGSKRLRFVIQKHRATRLHYDFRLEADGAMPSWAVPKGPTMVPGERRLAMHVEDHPLAYRTFEGVIPNGQYGAGEVIIWDEGWYELAEGTDPGKEIANGKIKFILHGKKLHGMFTLVKIKPKEGEHGDPWLLIKDHDGNDPTHYDIDDYPQSVKSGKTIEDIKKESHPKTWQSRPVDPPKKTRARRGQSRTVAKDYRRRACHVDR